MVRQSGTLQPTVPTPLIGISFRILIATQSMQSAARCEGPAHAQIVWFLGEPVEQFVIADHRDQPRRRRTTALVLIRSEPQNPAGVPRGVLSVRMATVSP